LRRRSIASASASDTIPARSALWILASIGPRVTRGSGLVTPGIDRLAREVLEVAGLGPG
jgi:hypothetical protein